MNNKEWFDHCIKNGTSGDQVFDILKDWKASVEDLKAEVKAIGQYWRNDWSDFDGRTLRYQLDDAVENYEKGIETFKYRNKLKEQESNF